MVTDPVGAGPEAARARAATDGIAGHAWMTPADGRALPFRAGCFDALVHSDAIC